MIVDNLSTKSKLTNISFKLHKGEILGFFGLMGAGRTELAKAIFGYDNISSGKYKTNTDIGVPSLRYFDKEVSKYCYMWRDGGQFSTERYLKNTDIKNDDNKI